MLTGMFCLSKKVVHLRYSWLNSLSSLELDGWEDLSHLDVSYNQLAILSMQPNTPISHLVYLDISGNRKLHSLQSIQVLQPSLRFLYAARCTLSDISALEDFQLLEVLDLERNILTSFVQRLPGLTKLNLRGNLISSLPDGICDAVGLVELNLQNLQLKSLPQEFGKLTNLERLNLRANKLANIAGVEKMTNLKFLDLTKPGNGISFTLCDLSRLANVTELRLVGMRLTEIPQSIMDLGSLFYLDLVQNSITSIPSSDTLLSHAVPWRRVNLAFNSLTEFPVPLLYLQGLEQICVRNNVFELPPHIDLLDPEDAIHVWRTTFNVTLTSSRRTSASSETLGALVGSELLHSFGPTSEQTDIQESIWFDLFSYRSEEKPSIPTPLNVIGELSRELIVDRIAGCLYGLALGDAIGLATEFMPKDMANFYYDNERGFDMKSFVHDQHRANFEAGDWTDDTDQCILILDNLVQHKGVFTPIPYAQSLKQWVNHGFSELNDEAGCGCGQHTYNVISHASFKAKPFAAASDVWEKSDRKSAPNGAVMRTAVLGCAQFWNLERIIADATAAAQVTHADPRCVASAVAVSSAISSLISADPSSTYADRVASALLTGQLSSKPFVDSCPTSQQEEFAHYYNANSTKALNLADGKSVGYTYKALGAGSFALRQARTESFETIITQITLEAGDADTNCAVAGALVGALIGFRALPAQWISQLRHTDWMNTKIKSLLDLYGICLEI
jgi:ADP-ribosylglycohydrolase